ncbi:YjjG family noncanonical pyrimidine nucleotidase [Myroides fluvii]|uniref:YjjG family noncanonical pyrimidine nucleotidase n=1 Tax=Myroides fluvii TaxID=2572594 RepID=UPI00131E6689|nr:YjjG family noncanonical pyrimidine nucleotidase [Myroides fluvii]
MDLKKFEHKTDIFFDLDHTLWDFEKNSALAFEQVLNEMKLPFTIEQFLNYYVSINADYWDRYSLNQISQAELRIGRIRDTFNSLAYATTTDKMLEVGDRYLSYLPNYNHLFDGAIEILDYLQEKYKLHIITNGFDQVQARKIKNSGMESYFQTVTNSERAGVKKPDAKIFTYALDLAQVQVKETVMIGDNLLADIEGAQKIGMDVIYYNEHHRAVPATLPQVNNLLDIKSLL